MQIVQKWQTAEGKKILVEDITHDHLSNIYHYCNLFPYQGKMHPIMDKLLTDKFNGEVMPYDPQYVFEVVELQKYGYLLMKNNVCVIILNGKKIGIVRPELLMITKQEHHDFEIG